MPEMAPEMATLALIALGVVAATLGSMVGMGGGSFITPFLLMFWGMTPGTAVSASLVAVLASSTSSVFSHVKAGGIDLKNGKVFSVFSVMGAVVGALLLLGMDPLFYPAALGSFLVLTGIAVWRRKPGGYEALEKRNKLARSYFRRDLKVTRIKDVDGSELRIPLRRGVGPGLSVLAGLASAIFGVGGGAVLTPGLMVFLRYPTRNAIATSQVVMAAGAAAGLVMLAIKDQVHPGSALWIAVGAWVGGKLGSRIARRADEAFLKAALGTLLVLVGGRLLFVWVASW